MSSRLLDEFRKSCYAGVALFLCCAPQLQATGSDFEPTLPAWRMTIDPAHLQQLDNYPFADDRYPAILQINDAFYEAQVRYRGRTSRNLPKRSWDVNFDSHGPGGIAATNLNAEYRDRSCIRNRLGFILGEKLGMDVPSGEFVSLFVNDKYAGVYHQVEDIDADFFERRGRPVPDLLIQGINHEARLAPLLNQSDFEYAYEIKEDQYESLLEFHLFCMYLQNSTHNLFGQQINQMVHVPNILSYYALQIAMTNHDGFNKNYYLAKEGDGRYRLYPWDCDATFGNDWTGEWRPNFGHETINQAPAINALMGRLLGVPVYHASFLTLLDQLATDLLPGLAADIDSLYELITPDALWDEAKVCSDEEFLAERDSLHLFLQRKSAALAGISGFENPRLKDVRVSKSYLTGEPLEELTFEARAELDLDYARGILIYREDDAIRYSVFSLNDDGYNGDTLAGDGLYTRTFQFPPVLLPVYWLVEAKRPSDVLFPSVPGSWLSFSDRLTSLPSLRSQDTAPSPGDVLITSLFDEGPGGSKGVELQNVTDRTIDLNGSVLRLGVGHMLQRLESIPLLEPGDTVYVVDRPAFVQTLPQDRVAPNPFFALSQAADSLYLINAAGAGIDSRKYQLEVVDEPVGEVVINEINYHSAGHYDTGDWFELYVREDEVDLSGWLFRDDNPTHTWEFPAIPPLHEGSYVVVAADTARFRSIVNETPAHLYGGFEFGLGNASDVLHLYDSSGRLVDVVSYRDRTPWPSEPDGNGPTLELIHPDMANYDHTNWRASLAAEPFGTPGRRNSVAPDTLPEPPPPPPPAEVPDRWEVLEIIPNPFNSRLKITIAAPEAGELIIDIYNVLGRKVCTLRESLASSGEASVFWDGQSEGGIAGSGLYFVVIREPFHSQPHKVILVR